MVLDKIPVHENQNPISVYKNVCAAWGWPCLIKIFVKKLNKI